MGITVYKSTVRLGGLIYEATGDGGGLETLGWTVVEVSDWEIGGECSEEWLG